MGLVGFLTAVVFVELCQREHMTPILRFFPLSLQLRHGSDFGTVIRMISSIDTISVGSSSLAMISARLSANLPAAN